MPVVNLPVQLLKERLGHPVEADALVEHLQHLGCDVEGYEEYVDVQIEGAVRQVASSHPYDEDQAEVEVLSLRRGSDEIAGALGVATGTSKAQLSRARAKLRVELADFAEEVVA